MVNIKLKKLFSLDFVKGGWMWLDYVRWVDLIQSGTWRWMIRSKILLYFWERRINPELSQGIFFIWNVYICPVFTFLLTTSSAVLMTKRSVLFFLPLYFSTVFEHIIILTSYFSEVTFWSYRKYIWLYLNNRGKHKHCRNRSVTSSMKLKLLKIFFRYS